MAVAVPSVSDTGNLTLFWFEKLEEAWKITHPSLLLLCPGVSERKRQRKSFGAGKSVFVGGQNADLCEDFDWKDYHSRSRKQ
jgi:hypothetical protein